LAQSELPPSNNKGMTQERMSEILGYVAGELTGPINNIQFVFNEVPMALLSDAKNNRMRIIAPITQVENLTRCSLRNVYPPIKRTYGPAT